VQDDHCEDGVCVDQQCVACRDQTDCTDPTAPRCNPQGDCVPCSQTEHCAHIEGKTLCDLGQCVQCTSTNDEPCGRDGAGERYVCDTLARTCSTHQRRSANVCDPCVSDAQCMAGQLCVMQRFDEVGDDPDMGELDVGYFCLWREDATQPFAPAGSCANAPPYFNARPGSESVDGTHATVCGFRVTTCAGYKDFIDKACDGLTDDARCGDPRFVSDGYCREALASTFRCTTPCLGADDCNVGAACTATAPKYCSLQ
jgi:hypothetical protein